MQPTLLGALLRRRGQVRARPGRHKMAPIRPSSTLETTIGTYMP